jgi:hypothetical protein
MRLLERNNAGEINLTKYIFGDNIPWYAILSHTWGADTEEVSFKDLIDGTDKSKPGYDKIPENKSDAMACNTSGSNTCCIDKSNNNEHSEAINSMFR